MKPNQEVTLSADLQDPLMDPRACAAYLKVSVLTLADWRTKGIGPDYVKLGAAVRYRRADVDSWLNLRKITAKGE